MKRTAWFIGSWLVKGGSEGPGKRLLAAVTAAAILSTAPGASVAVASAQATAGTFSNSDGLTCSWLGADGGYRLDCNGFSRTRQGYTSYSCDVLRHPASEEWFCEDWNGRQWSGDRRLPGSRVPPLSAWECPRTHPVKGNAQSGLYHTPASPHYHQTKPEDCFATADAARATGYR